MRGGAIKNKNITVYFTVKMRNKTNIVFIEIVSE